MPRKQFEDMPYDPIAADLAREVAAAGRGQPAPDDSMPRVQGNAVLQPKSAFPPIRSRAQEVAGRITKRFVLNRKEDDDLNAFLLRLQTKAETKVTLSVIVRAALSVVMQAEEHVLEEIGERFPQVFPSTHDSLALGEFEDRWTKILLRAMRRLPRACSN